ncbi:uncharacterized protein LOC142554278 [Primulina tabacum]|uniref:uncharacterized protein LOC142554278 n=1 Tax=Primulina tabacum TaxID=48773 RepID=UPI003F5A2C36
MGACFSAQSVDQKPSANVVSIDGQFRQYSLPVTASQLDPDQIYFVLSMNKLKYRLAASEMAALAVKASIALDKVNIRRRRSKARISPVLVAEEHPQANYQIQNKVSFDSPLGVISRSGSTRKMHRFSSRRAKLAVRSFRIRLSTIYEGSVLHAD